MLTDEDAKEFFRYAVKRWTLRADIVKMGKEYHAELYNFRNGRWLRHLTLRFSPTKFVEQLDATRAAPRERRVIYYSSDGKNLFVINESIEIRRGYNMGEDTRGYHVSIPDKNATLYTMSSTVYARLFLARNLFDMFDPYPRR